MGLAAQAQRSSSSGLPRRQFAGKHVGRHRPGCGAGIGQPATCRLAPTACSARPLFRRSRARRTARADHGSHARDAQTVWLQSRRSTTRGPMHHASGMTTGSPQRLLPVCLSHACAASVWPRTDSSRKLWGALTNTFQLPAISVFLTVQAGSRWSHRLRPSGCGRRLWKSKGDLHNRYRRASAP